MLYGTVRRTDWRVRTSNELLRLEQAVEVTPSWDCVQDCHHDQKANHGVGGEHLRLFLRAADIGIVLTLSTNLRQGRAFYRMGRQLRDDDVTAYREPYEPYVSPDYLHEHFSLRTETEQVRNNTPPDTCDVLASALCYGGEMQCSIAEKIWTPDDTSNWRHTLTNEKYDEIVLVNCAPVWKRMVDYLLAARDKMLTAHAKLPHRCPTCQGAGVVPSVSLSQFNPPSHD